MMDIFDHNMDSTEIEAKYPLLHLLEKKLPQCIVERSEERRVGKECRL